MEIRELEKSFQTWMAHDLRKIVFSAPKTGEVKRVAIQKIQHKNQEAYRFEYAQPPKVYHAIHSTSETLAQFMEFVNNFREINGICATCAFHVKISKKGNVLLQEKNNTQVQSKPLTGFNQEKKYAIGGDCPILTELGIASTTGKILASGQDKFRQINRFLEFILEVIPDRCEKPFYIVDFGCGKSYLSFLVYYYLHEILHIPVYVEGLDLKADVVENCNALAKKYGYAMQFFACDIRDFHPKNKPDMVISLHACNTATDYALYHAVRWQAKYIFSVPCCQHEVAQQLKTEVCPILLRHGIIKERYASLVTDAVRCELLNACGYHAQIMEFVEIENSPKNLLIRAVRKGKTDLDRLHAVQEFCGGMGIRPTFLQEVEELLQREKE